MDTITLTDIAELNEAIGRPAAAETYRYLGQQMPVTPEDEERIDAAWQVLDEVPQVSARGKHDTSCWRKHVPCLAERVRRALR